MSDVVCFTNCKLCRGGEAIEEDIWVENGIILDKQHSFYVDKKTPTKVLDCHGLFLTPGIQFFSKILGCPKNIMLAYFSQFRIDLALRVVIKIQ